MPGNDLNLPNQTWTHRTGRPDSAHPTPSTSRTSLPFKKRGWAIASASTVVAQTHEADASCATKSTAKSFAPPQRVASKISTSSGIPRSRIRSSRRTFKSRVACTGAKSSSLSQIGSYPPHNRFGTTAPKRRGRKPIKAALKSLKAPPLKAATVSEAVIKTTTTNRKQNRGCQGQDRSRARAMDTASGSALKIGRWTLEERKAFLRGLKEYGKGKWSKIAKGIPTRDTTQVKTHAQIVLKHLKNGDNIFAILEDPSDPSIGRTTIDPSESKIERNEDEEGLSVPDPVCSQDMKIESDISTNSSLGSSYVHSPVTNALTSDTEDDSHKNWRNLFSPIPVSTIDISIPTDFDNHGQNGEATSSSSNPNRNVVEDHRTPSYLQMASTMKSPAPFSNELSAVPFSYDFTPPAPSAESKMYNYAIPPSSSTANNGAMNTATNIPSATSAFTPTIGNDTTATRTLVTACTHTAKHSAYDLVAKDMDERSSVAKILMKMSSPPPFENEITSSHLNRKMAAKERKNVLNSTPIKRRRTTTAVSLTSIAPPCAQDPTSLYHLVQSPSRIVSI